MMISCLRRRRRYGGACLCIAMTIIIFHWGKLSYLTDRESLPPIEEESLWPTASGDVEDAFTSVTCDPGSECFRLRQLVTSWPDSKPKAAIYFLTRPNVRPFQVRETVTTLFKYFNNRFQYPVIIFYTGNMTTETDIILSELESRELIFMQAIEFPIPKIFPKMGNTHCPGGLGYRHMCRFHANTVYLHPMLRGLEYAWRLDDDSQLLAPAITYDVFAFMKEHEFVYGYRHLALDWASCVPGLWDAARKYEEHERIDAQFIDKWPNRKIFYNNFEISQVSFWTSPEYRGYIEYIDRLGGIYRDRWGDAPIKSLGLALFVTPAKIHKFDDVGYRHQSTKKYGRLGDPEPHLLYEDLQRK